MLLPMLLLQCDCLCIMHGSTVDAAALQQILQTSEKRMQRQGEKKGVWKKDPRFKTLGIGCSKGAFRYEAPTS